MNLNVVDKLEELMMSIVHAQQVVADNIGMTELTAAIFCDLTHHALEVARAVQEAMKEAKDTPSEDMIVLSRALEGLYGGAITDGLRDASRMIAAKTLFDAALPAGDDEESPDVS